jgi:hypothetical protein
LPDFNYIGIIGVIGDHSSLGKKSKNEEAVTPGGGVECAAGIEECGVELGVGWRFRGEIQNNLVS